METISSLLQGRTFCARINTQDRPKFIALARLFVGQLTAGNTLCSDDLVDIARRYGYSKQAPRNAILRLEVERLIKRTERRQCIFDAKRPAIIYERVET